MSQDYTTTNSRKQRRAARANRSRPVLVTGTEQEQETQQTTDSAVATSAPAAEEAAPVAPAPAPKSRMPHMPRLPNFFPTVGKTEQDKSLEQEAKETEVAQARIARATRTSTSKVTPSTKTPVIKTEKALAAAKSAEEKPEKPAPPASRPAPTAPTRPTSTFKTRYIFGMVLYLIAAQVIGVFVTGLFQKYGLDAVLAQFALFGGNVVIRTSTIVYLAFLVVLLVLLARFDLLPRSLGAAMNPSASNQERSNSTHSASRGEETRPQVKQGVAGADDALYQQYRANQRRGKKK